MVTPMGLSPQRVLISGNTYLGGPAPPIELPKEPSHFGMRDPKPSLQPQCHIVGCLRPRLLLGRIILCEHNPGPGSAHSRAS
jgi:hypothetical protein